MKALSIRQPWAWLIVNGWKNIENREWPTHFRGRFLIHSSKSMTRAEYQACRLFMAGFTTLDIPPAEQLERGGIVGEAVLLNCVRRHDSEWFCGPFGFVLGEAKPLPFIPYKGTLGFFNVELPSEASEAPRSDQAVSHSTKPDRCPECSSFIGGTRLNNASGLYPAQCEREAGHSGWHLSDGKGWPPARNPGGTDHV